MLNNFNYTKVLIVFAGWRKRIGGLKGLKGFRVSGAQAFKGSRACGVQVPAAFKGSNAFGVQGFKGLRRSIAFGVQGDRWYDYDWSTSLVGGKANQLKRRSVAPKQSAGRGESCKEGWCLWDRIASAKPMDCCAANMDGNGFASHRRWSPDGFGVAGVPSKGIAGMVVIGACHW